MNDENITLMQAVRELDISPEEFHWAMAECYVGLDEYFADRFQAVLLTECKQKAGIFLLN